MKYERLERSDVDHTADTVGLWPGIAGIYIENHAAHFCPQCGKDILGEELYEQLKEDDLGYNHPKADELGNVAVLLSDAESDCPGDYCDHCGIRLDTTVLHYDGVCQPDWCERE